MTFDSFNDKIEKARLPRGYILNPTKLRILQFKCAYCGSSTAEIIGYFDSKDEQAAIFTFCGKCKQELPKMLAEYKKLRGNES